MTLIRHTQQAPENSVFALTAFDRSLGKSIPLKAEGEIIGAATLVGALPSDDRRSIELVWEIDELTEPAFIQWWLGVFAVDDFVPEDAYNPAAAIEKVRRASEASERRAT